MLRDILFVLTRKALHGKSLFLIFLGVLAFDIYLSGLFERNEEGESFQLSSWSESEELSSDIARRQRLRRKRIIDHCRNRVLNKMLPKGPKNGVSSDAFRHIIVNDKYRFLYCQVPKVATSNWKRVFMVLNDNARNVWQIGSVDVHNQSRQYFRYLHEYKPSEIVVRLRTYYKFLFVRHPFERLASAYRNKFTESNSTYFNRIYGRYIIRHFRKSRQKTTISFREFARYIVEGKDEVMDNHWRLYDDLCKPCLIYYDFVGYFRELDRDANDILRILNVSDKVSFPRNITSEFEVPTSLIVDRYFSELSKNLQDRLYEKYQYDFEMFGYDKQ